MSGLSLTLKTDTNPLVFSIMVNTRQYCQIMKQQHSKYLENLRQTGAVLVVEPTYNCQLFSIAGIQSLFDLFLRKSKSDKKDVDYEELAGYLEAWSERIDKYCVLLDVSPAYNKMVEDMAKHTYKGVIAKTKYESSNGHDMFLYILQVRRNDAYEDDGEENYDEDEYWDKLD